MNRACLVLVAGLALSGCGGSAASPPPSNGPSSSAAAPSVVAPAKPASSPSAATAAKPASSAPAAASSSAPIKVGLLMPLTGPLSDVGKDNQDGFNLYMDAINSTVAGRKIELTYADTLGQPDVGLTKAKQLVENSKVQIIMGLNNTPVCYAVASYVKQTAHVPMLVTTNCTAQRLTTDPQYASPYLIRLTSAASNATDPVAVWAAEKGYKKAILMIADYGGGIENGDAFASAFIKHGGSIVQEQYPALGTADYGPFAAQLNKDADLLVAFLPGADGLKFYQQYENYAAGRKLQVVDLAEGITSGPNRKQLGDKAAGIVATWVHSTAIESPMNSAFLKAFAAKYPGRLIPKDSINGYAGAQILEAAIKKVNGNVENTDQFLNAVYGTDMDTLKGHVKLDAQHDIIENSYIFEITPDLQEKLLKTDTNVSLAWDRTPDELAHFPFGKMKGKWVGMTKDQLQKLSS